MLLTVLYFLSVFLPFTSSIQCYTCNEASSVCSLPLNLDTGDESTENNVESIIYDSEFVCQSDHSFDPYTGLEKLILRGTRECEDLNIINRRVFCCKTNNCNKILPPMTLQTKIYSNDQRYLPSIALISFLLVFQCFLN